MSAEQNMAVVALRRALAKVRDADLKLLVYDGSVFVCPTEVDVQARGCSAFDILEQHGAEVGPPGLSADGGAGS